MREKLSNLYSLVTYSDLPTPVEVLVNEDEVKVWVATEEAKQQWEKLTDAEYEVFVSVDSIDKVSFHP